MNEDFCKGIRVTLAIVFILFCFTIVILDFIRIQKVNNFCRDRGYDFYEHVSNGEHYFNCCKKVVNLNGKYISEKECIAGGIYPKLFGNVKGGENNV